MCDRQTINIYNNSNSVDSTCENVGLARQIYVNNTSDPFQFRSLNTVSGLSIVENGNELDFTNTLPGKNITNLGVGEQLITTISPTEYGCKSLVSGSNITLTDNTTDVIISATGGSAPDYLDDSCNLGLSTLYDIQTTPSIVIMPNLLIPGGFNGLRYNTSTGVFTVLNTGIYNISFCLAHYRNGSNQTGVLNFYVTLNNNDNLRLISTRTYGTVVFADVNYLNASANVRLESGNTVELIAKKSLDLATCYIDNNHSNFSITRVF